MLPNSKAPSLATWAPEGGAAGAGPAWGGLLVPRTPAPSWVRAVCRDALFLIPTEAAPRVPDKGAPWLPPGNPEDAPLPEEVAQGLGSARSGGSCPLHLPLLSPDPRPLILPPLPTGRVLERGSCDFQSCSEKGRPRGAVAPMPPPTPGCCLGPSPAPVRQGETSRVHRPESGILLLTALLGRWQPWRCRAAQTHQGGLSKRRASVTNRRHGGQCGRGHASEGLCLVGAQATGRPCPSPGVGSPKPHVGVSIGERKGVSSGTSVHTQALGP